MLIQGCLKHSRYDGKMARERGVAWSILLFLHDHLNLGVPYLDNPWQSPACYLSILRCSFEVPAIFCPHSFPSSASAWAKCLTIDVFVDGSSISHFRHDRGNPIWLVWSLWKIGKSIWMNIFPIYGNIKNVPNHQPAMFCAVNPSGKSDQWFCVFSYGLRKTHTHRKTTRPASWRVDVGHAIREQQDLGGLWTILELLKSHDTLR